MIDFLLDMGWGDAGKGRYVDLISPNYQFVVRCVGGDNAGHSILADDKLFKLHLIPSCILHPNVKMVLGAGMVINIQKFMEEVILLQNSGINITPENLFVSELAHIITPKHIQQDIDSENALGTNKIGTTKRGIGPAYVDKYNRKGIRLCDAIDFPGNCGIDDIEFIEPFVKDTREILYTANRRGDNILCEGAQGALLDISWGTYPYVTSSDTLVYGCLQGMGIGVRDIGKIIGIVKVFQTRIGAGPMPTEIKDQELVTRLRGDGSRFDDEYGRTTGRPRRIGWLDIPNLNYAIELNSVDELALTKLDILTGLDRVIICTNHYPTHYTEFPGWERLGNRYDDFPKEAKNFIKSIEALTDTPIHMISIGPERNQMVYK